jgi:hypothetical protein
LLDWWTIVQRLPPGGKTDEWRKQAEQIVRSRLNLQGTTLGFSGSRGGADDRLWWLMVCPDANAARVLVDALEGNAWREDQPRLARGLLLRQERGHWDCTTSNAWGTVAVGKFAAAYEATPVSGASTATVGDEVKTVTWAQPPQPLSVHLAWPSGVGTLSIDHRGSGNPWVTVQSRAAVPLDAPLSSGYRIRKTIEPVEARVPGRYSVGDILRVRLEVEAQSDMTWVVVNDPIPAGASHLGTGLGRDSQISTSGEKKDDWNAPAYAERAFDGYRAYYEFVPKGDLAVEYTIRLNQSGRLELPTTRVEALYAPEMFGEIPNPAMVVEP